jgi:uncharacterized protein (DUF488 family)
MTLGHSNRTMEAFVGLLQVHGVETVVDVRTVPRSRHNPQFNREALPKSLEGFGIGYLHMPGLGGFRHTRSDSMNRGWRTEGFRGYADYMETEEFRKNLEELIRIAGRKQVAIMCAEALFFRCHRQLISDALLVRGVRVEHITDPTHRQPHKLTPWARFEEGTITYPETPDPQPRDKTGNE